MNAFLKMIVCIELMRMFSLRETVNASFYPILIFEIKTAWLQLHIVKMRWHMANVEFKGDNTIGQY